MTALRRFLKRRRHIVILRVRGREHTIEERCIEDCPWCLSTAEARPEVAFVQAVG